MLEKIDNHGFDEFLSNGSQNYMTQSYDNVKKIAASWSNYSVLLGDGSLRTWGHQHKTYNNILKECVDITRDVTFVDNSLVVTNNEGHICVITDKHRCCNVHIPEDQIKNNQIIKFTGTDKELIFLLDTNVCFQCENICSPLDCIKDQLLKSTPLPVSILSSSIASVSCGKEHTLLLTTYGSVLSFGGGSRGQLGHGTVDSNREPKLVEYLAGLKMLEVAAGGWHSLCISECGDIYCWGWNESGQLGLPCKTVKEKRHTVSKQKELHKLFRTDMDKEEEQESVLQISKEESAYESKLQNAASSETQHEMCSSVTQNIQPPQASLDKYESLLFVQNTDPVQVQSFPCLIDLKDQFIIQRASCGSRHTALLTEDGILLTSGWNDYAQLCHEDKVTRDYFETVTKYIKSGTKIKDVYCGPWSTFVIT